MADHNVEVVESHGVPEVEHTDEFYRLVRIVPKKGRRKRGEPATYEIVSIPWDDLNASELRALCSHNMIPSSREEMAMWRVLHPGVLREDVIRLIRGEIDPADLDGNPVHHSRNLLGLFIWEYFHYLWSQLDCNTCCWECPDGKALECELNNQKDLQGQKI